MLTYVYERFELYSSLFVMKDGKTAIIIFDWHGLSHPSNTISVRAMKPLSEEEFKEINRVLESRGMRSI